MTENFNQNKILWLRVSYWIGAIADFVVGIAMLYPRIFTAVYNIENYIPDRAFRSAMFLAAATMFGWTVILLWADRKPVERRGILLITIFPPIIGLAGAGVYAVTSGFITLPKMIPTWIFQLFLIILFSYSYFNSKGDK